MRESDSQDWSKEDTEIVEYKVSQRKTGKYFNREHIEKRNIFSGDKMKKWIKLLRLFAFKVLDCADGGLLTLLLLASFQ